MPPVDRDGDRGRGRPYPGPLPNRPASDRLTTERPTTTATDWPPPLLDPAVLAELPIPLQMMVATVLLPYEVAITSVKIMKNTEALLAEMVFHMNALRPAVGAVSQAYADGQFDQVFRTIDQIQHGTNAFALVFAPLTAVRDRFVPGTTVTVQPPPPPRPRSPYPRQAPPMAITPPPVRAQPSTAEYLGRLGGKAWEQASTLPGAGLLRRAGRPLAQAWSAAVPTAGPSAAPVEDDDFSGVVGMGPSPDFGSGYDERPEPGPGSPAHALMSLAEPLVPGAVRRLFGGN